MDHTVCCKSSPKHHRRAVGVFVYGGVALVGKAAMGCEKNYHRIFHRAILGIHVCRGEMVGWFASVVLQYKIT